MGLRATWVTGMLDPGTKMLPEAALYSYSLDWRTTAFLFVPRTNLFARSHRLRATHSFEYQTNCCCLRSQSVTVLLYTFIFSKFSYSLFPLTYPLDVFNILIRQVREYERRLDIVTSISRNLLNQ